MSQSGQLRKSTAPGGDGIQTINTIGPNGGGDFTISSSDGSVTITPIANGLDLQAGSIINPVLSVYMQNPQSIASAVLTDIAFDGVWNDPAGGYSGGLYTVPKGGVWMLSMYTAFNSTAGFVNGDVFITVNPSNYLTHITSTATISATTIVVSSGSVIISLNMGDVISVKCNCSTVGGTNFDVLGYGNGAFNTFNAVRISD